MDNSPGKDVCEAPEHRNGLRVMDIHPVDMECYNGNRNQTFSPSSYNMHRLQHQWADVSQIFEMSMFSLEIHINIYFQMNYMIDPITVTQLMADDYHSHHSFLSIEVRYNLDHKYVIVDCLHNVKHAKVLKAEMR